MIIKKLAVVLFVFLAVSFIGKTSKNYAEIRIKPSSKLTIHGVTNITNFACNFHAITLKNSIPVSYSISDNQAIFEHTKLVLDNKEFDCGRHIIDKDFNKLLKSETYPQITIHLKKVTRSDSKKITATVDFVIAGVTKTYIIPITVSHDLSLKVDGSIRLNIRDFGLENPKKVLGLIKIEDVVTIHFQLDMDVL